MSKVHFDDAVIDVDSPEDTAMNPPLVLRTESFRPPPITNVTGEFTAFTETQRTSSPPSSSLSHSQTLDWNRAESFRLYAAHAMSFIKPSSSFFEPNTPLSASDPKIEVMKAQTSLKNYITLNGVHAASAESSLPMNIQKGPKIGSGGYAEVFSGINTSSGELVAIKEIKIDKASKQQFQDVELEFKLLQQLKHPSVIRYYLFESSVSQHMARIVMEFMAGGSALDLIHNFGPLPEVLLQKFAREVLQGLQFIHREGITHRDIKPANILIHANGAAKIADFGCSKRMSESSQTNHVLGTPVYMAPESIRGNVMQRSDIWAFGCTMLQVSTGKVPWSHTNITNHLQLMFHITTSYDIPVIPESFTQHFQDFLKKCFTRDHEKRPDAEMLLSHPFMVESIAVETPGGDSCVNTIEQISAKHCTELCHHLTTDSLLGPALADDQASLSSMSPTISPRQSPQQVPVKLNSSSNFSGDSGGGGGTTFPSSSTAAAGGIGGIGGNSFLSSNKSQGAFGSSTGSLMQQQPSFVIEDESMCRPQVLMLNQLGGENIVTAVATGEEASETEDEEEEDTLEGRASSSDAAAARRPSISGPVHLDLPVQAGGKIVNVKLDFSPQDVSVKMLDRKPSFVLNMNPNVMSQLQSVMSRLEERNTQHEGKNNAGTGSNLLEDEDEDDGEEHVSLSASFSAADRAKT